MWSDLANECRATRGGKRATTTQRAIMGQLYLFTGKVRNMGLAELRKAKGLSQVKLAKASGVASSRIADIERGRRDIRNASLATVLKLADALKVKDLRKFLEP